MLPKPGVARYDDIAAVTGDDIRLAMTKDTFVQMREGGLYGYGATSDSASSRTAQTDSDDIRVPVQRAVLRWRVLPARRRRAPPVRGAGATAGLVCPERRRVRERS